jgi:hypothetical protein
MSMWTAFIWLSLVNMAVKMIFENMDIKDRLGCDLV